MTLQTTRTEPQTAEQVFAANGYDKNGKLIGARAPKDEAFPGDETRHLDYFGSKLASLSPDSDEREEARSTTVDVDVIEDVIAREKARVDSLAEAARERDEAFTELKKPLRARDGSKVAQAQATLERTARKIERLEEAERHVEHLTELHKLTKRNRARETLKVRDLASIREFVDAVLTGDMHKAHDMMLAVVRKTEEPYALRIACIGGMIQIAPLVGTDDGGKFNDAWLSRTTGIPRSTCKELIDAHRDVGTDLAMLLLGTENEGRKGVQEWRAMMPERQSAAVEGLKQYHTAQMIAHAVECEDVARARKISLSEADVLDAVGMNNREGREQLVQMPLKAKQLWLAKMLDQTNEAAERTGGIVSTERGATDPKKGRLVKPLPEWKPTGRLLSMQRLSADNVYEL